MKKILFQTVILLFIFPVLSHADSFTMSTYYPAPFGRYQQLISDEWFRLTPHEDIITPPNCEMGTMYVNLSGELKICGVDGTFGDAGVWNQGPTGNPDQVWLAHENYYKIKVGIGTRDPKFKLHLDNDGGILGIGKDSDPDGASLPNLGYPDPGETDTRFIWYAKRGGALRAGRIKNQLPESGMMDAWDDLNIGHGSVAMGANNLSSGADSFAMGAWSQATGARSTAIGNSVEAHCPRCVALGANIAVGNINNPEDIADSFGIGLKTNPFDPTAPRDVQPEHRILQSHTMAIMGGNVGIGTVAPDTMLHIHNTTGQGSFSISGESDNNKTYSALYLHDNQLDNYEDSWYIAHKNMPGTEFENDLVIGKWSGQPTDRVSMIFDDQDGNVGIGTANPKSLLHVKDGSLIVEESLDDKFAQIDIIGERPLSGGDSPNASLNLRKYGVDPWTYSWAITDIGTGSSSSRYRGAFQVGQHHGSAAIPNFDRAFTITHDTDDGLMGDVLGSADSTYFRAAIGKWTHPDYKLYVEGDLFVDGNIRYSGELGQRIDPIPSDKRLKKNIARIIGALDKIEALNGVYFDWRKDEFPEKNFTDRHQIGVIAQDIEPVLPELVSKGPDGFKRVNYEPLVAVLIEAVKELKEENNELRSQINELKNLIQKN